MAERMTDTKRIARFIDLKPISYFVLMRKKEMDNIGGDREGLINQLW